MKNSFVKIIIFLALFIFIFSISGSIIADSSNETKEGNGHESPTTNKPVTTETRPVVTTTSTIQGETTSTFENFDETTTVSASPSTSKYETDYILTSQDKVLLVSPSVCYVSSLWTARVYDDHLQKWSGAYNYGPVGGTGFCINPETGHIVTAAHVIDVSYKQVKENILDQYIKETYPEDYETLSESDWDTISSHFKLEGFKSTAPDREVWVQFNTATAGIPDSPDENHIRAEVISISNVDNRDIGVIQITAKIGRALSGAIIGDSSLVEILDPVTIIGYPWTSDVGQDNILNPTITEGSLSGRITLSGTEIMQIQGNAREGNSGGPVLDFKGEVVGIITMASDSTNNYLRPSNDIKILLGKIKNKTGLVDEEWKTGLIMYREQHYVEAIKHFNAVLNLNGGHILAQEYKSKAQSRIADDKPLVSETTLKEVEKTSISKIETAQEKSDGFKNSKTLLIIIFSGGFVLLAGITLIIIFVLRRNNKKNKTKSNYKVTSSRQPTITIEELKADREDKTVNGIKAKFCTNCGLKVEDNQVFCSNCGARLK
ncbi:MAG: trypsin-like peptidase domain-containing protein [Candidatus Humimicrobiaceae bacterium]